MNNYTVKITARGQQAIVSNVHVTYYNENREKRQIIIKPNTNSFERNYRALHNYDFSVFGQATLPSPVATTTTTTTTANNTTNINVFNPSIQPISIEITIFKDGAVLKHEVEHSNTGSVSEETDTDGD